MSSMSFDTGHTSLLGTRNLNQDRCAVLETGDALLLVMADGLGGHPKGEKAAQIMIDTCTEAFREVTTPVPRPKLLLKHLFLLAHRRIVRFGQRQEPAIAPRTTAVLALVQKGTAFWAHVGDSRCYLFRNGRLLTRTIDHSQVERLRSQGIISAGECNTHPQRNLVTRCLGGARGLPEVEYGKPVRLCSNDVLLLCSDGFWEPLGTGEIGHILNDGTPLNQALNQLARKAEKAAWPDCDNTSAVACRWLGEIPTYQRPQEYEIP